MSRSWIIKNAKNAPFMKIYCKAQMPRSLKCTAKRKSHLPAWGLKEKRKNCCIHEDLLQSANAAFLKIYCKAQMPRSRIIKSAKMLPSWRFITKRKCSVPEIVLRSAKATLPEDWKKSAYAAYSWPDRKAHTSRIPDLKEKRIRRVFLTRRKAHTPRVLDLKKSAYAACSWPKKSAYAACSWP